MLMKTAVRPVAHTRHQSVPDRIEMDVVDMTSQVSLIAYDVLPIAALPNSFFTPDNLA